MTVLSDIFAIIMDYGIGAFCRVNIVVDSINTTDKLYSKEKYNLFFI